MTRIIAIGCFLAGCYLAAQYSRTWIYDYTFGETEFEVRALRRWRIYRAPYCVIRGVYELPTSELIMLALSIGKANFWVNRLFVRHVAIEVEEKLLLVISPRRSREFCVQLRARCPALLTVDLVTRSAGTQ